MSRRNFLGNVKNTLCRGTIMKSKKTITYLIIVFFLFTFVASCAGTYEKESTGEYVDDSVITTKVKARIF